MNTQERLNDILELGIFNNTELELDDSGNENTFKSWEYYLIIHLSNEDLYYTDDETLQSYEESGERHETSKGVIYCF